MRPTGSRRYGRAAARRARRVCVQTQTMADRLSRTWGIPRERMSIVPNGPSAFLQDQAAGPGGAVRSPWTILAIGNPKPTKNLEIVPPVGRALRDAGQGAGRFVMTFGSDDEPYLQPFRAALETWGEAIPIERVGHVPHQELAPLYREADVVFLPSLLESFSATYVEAMHFGVPLVTSDYDFARDICGPAAEYVDPLDPEDCARGLLRVLTDEGRRTELRDAGFQRVEQFPDWAGRYRLYRSTLDDALAHP